MKQPWADALMAGLKTIETRTWGTRYRGWVLITTSLQPDGSAILAMHQALGEVKPFAGARLLGHAIGLVRIDDCRPMVKADERAAMCPCSPGRMAWIIGETRPLAQPVKIRGHLGLWMAPPVLGVACPEEECGGAGGFPGPGKDGSEVDYVCWTCGGSGRA